LAIWGAAVMHRNRNPFAWPLIAAAVAYSGIYLVVEVGARYRFPIEGILLVFASVPVAQVLRRWAPKFLADSRGILRVHL
jgi:hypothetical protein